MLWFASIKNKRGDEVLVCSAETLEDVCLEMVRNKDTDRVKNNLERQITIRSDDNEVVERIEYLNFSELLRNNASHHSKYGLVAREQE